MAHIDLPPTGGRFNTHSLLWTETETDAGKVLLVQASRGPEANVPHDTMFLPLCRESAEALRRMAHTIDVALNPELLTKEG